MKMEIGSDYTNNRSLVVDCLKSMDRSAYVFANSPLTTFRLVKNLETKLDQANVQIDVLHIYGNLPENTKSDIVNIFFQKVVFEGFSLKAL